MATAIYQKVIDLALLSGGTVCKEVDEYLTQNYPGWDMDTIVEVLPYVEGLRQTNILQTYPYMVRAFNGPKQDQFIVWCIERIKSYLPDQYARTEELTLKLDDLIAYINNPTEILAEPLKTYAKTMAINFNNPHDVMFANNIRGIINVATHINYSHQDITGMAIITAKLGEFSGVSRYVIQNEMLDEVEILWGLVDE